MKRMAMMAVAAAATAMVAVPTWADEHLDRIGGWIVLTSEPSAGHVITQVSHTEGPYTIELYCASGPWSAYIFDSSQNDSSTPVAPVSLSYSLDGGSAKRIPGQGHKRYRFELAHSANGFIEDLTRGANTLSFEIEGGPRKSLRIGQARSAVASSLSRCPLAGG